jgi:predicted Zn-dependent protease
MQQAFNDLADRLFQNLRADEVLLLTFNGERSDFVRLNQNRIRQAGRVEQRVLNLQLIRDTRHASMSVTLTGTEDDEGRSAAALRALRDQLPFLPPDPHLAYSRDVAPSEQIAANELPDPAEAIEQLVGASEGCDLVGFWASGDIHVGFANSLGEGRSQRNWFTTHNFNLDWSLYHQADKAVKCGYAGTRWDRNLLNTKIERAKAQLAVLSRPAKTIKPGSYRAYLAPSAMQEVVGLLSWGGFGLKAQRTKRSPLMRAVDGKASFAKGVTLSEHTGAGLSPGFQGQGYLKPSRVCFVRNGLYEDALVSPRSAVEYGVPTNGASGGESPVSFEMEGGDLNVGEVLNDLGTGVLVNNLWYLNYSDRPACRVTGMTRFATLWVEDGEIVAPLNVMRFDDSAYRMLGDGLLGLTQERELLLSPDTYGKRSTESARLPGALIDDFRFTL